MLRAPSSMAVAMSRPVPVVSASIGSLPSAPPTRTRPEAAAISMKASVPSSRQPASTGTPRGPGTVVRLLAPPSTSSDPSPPSARGTVIGLPPAVRTAAAAALANSTLEAEPRNLSKARTTVRVTGTCWHAGVPAG